MQKFLNLLFAAAAFCLLTGCASMFSNNLPKKIYQFNFSESREENPASDFKKQIGGNVTIFPFIDRRNADDINFALQKPISIVARDWLAAELKKDKLFGNIDVSDNTVQLASGKNTIYGIIETFRMYYDISDTMINEDSGIVYKTYCTFAGKIIYIENDGRAIVHEYIGTTEIYMPFKYFKSNNLNCYAPDSSLPDKKYQEFDTKLANMFSQVMRDACNDIAHSNKFTYFYNSEPGDYINNDAKFLAYNKYDEIAVNESLVVGFTIVGSTAIGILAGTLQGRYGSDASDADINGEVGGVFGMFIGGAIGSVVGMVLDGIFVSPEYKKQSFYAEYPRDGNKGLILCKNF
jgi:hypothetical protein